MEDGFYWARWKDEDAEWEIVRIDKGWLESMGTEGACGERWWKKQIEFVGEKIERPMTNDEIEAMES